VLVRLNFFLRCVKLLACLFCFSQTKSSCSNWLYDAFMYFLTHNLNSALEEDVQEEAKTFVPGAGRTAEEAFSHSFTPEQKQQIREMIEQADDPEEIDVIEASVARGEFPAFASRKRKSFGDGDDAGKKARTE